jgi:hypothetical protein
MKKLLMILGLALLPVSSSCTSTGPIATMAEPDFATLQRTVELTARIAARRSGIDQSTLIVVASILDAILDRQVSGDITLLLRNGLISSGLDDPEILDLAEILTLNVLPSNGLYTSPETLNLSERGKSLIRTLSVAISSINDSSSSK